MTKLHLSGFALILAQVFPMTGGGSITTPVSFANGGTGLSTAADDTTLVSSGSAWVAKALPDSDGVGQALQYDTTGNAFSVRTLYSKGRTAADVQTTSGTAYSDVTGLTFSVAANTTYSIQCNLIYTTAASTTAIRVALNGPASPTNLAGVIETLGISGGATNTYSSTHVFSGYDSDMATASGGTTGAYLVLNATLENGANAGTLAVRLKSEIDTSAVTVLRGSFCLVF